MYYRQPKTGLDPFFDFAHKKSVYHYFFEHGTKSGFAMYLASGKENYLGGLSFKNPLFFDGKNFKPTRKTICADAIYDRSGGLKFPSPETKKILNTFEFKTLCNDKNSMYSLLGKFMPKSIKIKNQSELKIALASFPKNELAVLKPAKGLGGKGIVIAVPGSLAETNLENEKEYVLQQFVDTSGGIKNITQKKHDLRIIIINGEIVLAHIRQPKEGSYLANVAQGGKIEELSLEKIPAKALEVTKKIQAILDKKYHYPIYSIDFGFENEKPFVFELNDQIGFPSEHMQGQTAFIQKLIAALGKIAAAKWAQ
jgi:glutathione synthase/RimK-type ligase-like ATP-grasp enzyme